MNASVLRSLLRLEFGLDVDVDTSAFTHDGTVAIRPQLGPHGRGVSIVLQKVYVVTTARIEIESFGRKLIGLLSDSTGEQRQRFASIADELGALRAAVSLEFDEGVVNATAPETWPRTFKVFRVRVASHPSTPERMPASCLESEFAFWGGVLLSMILGLLLKRDPSVFAEERGLPEGARKRVEVNRYERSPVNRRLCIEAHGAGCSVCGFDFGRAFGSLGAGFIHVHHLTPVAGMGPGYLVDPEKDLVPVCPNCHAMLHRDDPPITIASLKEVRVSALGEVE